MCYEDNVHRHAVTLNNQFAEKLNGTTPENIVELAVVFTQINNLYNTVAIKYSSNYLYLDTKRIRDIALSSIKFMTYTRDNHSAFIAVRNTASIWVSSLLFPHMPPLLDSIKEKSEKDNVMSDMIKKQHIEHGVYENRLEQEVTACGMAINNDTLTDIQRNLLSHGSSIDYGYDHKGQIQIENIDSIHPNYDVMMNQDTELNAFKRNCLEAILAYDPERHDTPFDEIRMIVEANELIHSYPHQIQKLALEVIKKHIRSSNLSLNLREITNAINTHLAQSKTKYSQINESIYKVSGPLPIDNTAQCNQIKNDNLASGSTTFETQLAKVESATASTLAAMKVTPNKTLSQRCL